MASEVVPLDRVPNNIEYKLDHRIKYNVTPIALKHDLNNMTDMHGTNILYYIVYSQQ